MYIIRKPVILLPDNPDTKSVVATTHIQNFIKKDLIIFPAFVIKLDLASGRLDP